MTYSDLFINNIINLYRNDGQAWLNSLPNIVSEIQSLWCLKNITQVDNMTYHYVAKAVTKTNQSVVIKIGFDKKTTLDEMNALRFFNGDGAIRLIDYNDKYNALLLEQATPGSTLKSLNEMNNKNVLDYYIKTMSILHHKPLDKNYHFSRLEDWLKAIDKVPKDSLPMQLLEKAIHLKNDLLTTTTTHRVLHGDLHLDNVLLHEDRWVAIDPKGVVGDPAFEIFALDFIDQHDLNNATDVTAQLNMISERIATKSKLCATRIKNWTFVRLILSAAWSIQDNDDPSRTVNIANRIKL